MLAPSMCMSLLLTNPRTRKERERRKREEKEEGTEEGVEETDLNKEGERARVESEKEEDVVDETREKEKLMTAEEFEKIIEGVRPEGSEKDDNVASADVGVETTEDPDNVGEGNLSNEKAEGGKESKKEAEPQEEDEGGKERRNAKRKLILETTEEMQATGQKAKEGETVEISSEDEEEVTPLKRRNRAILTEKEGENAVEQCGETTPVAAPKSVALVAAKDTPTPVVTEGKPAPESEEHESEEEKYQRERKRKGKQPAKTVKQAKKKPRKANPNVVIQEPVQVPFQPEGKSGEETSSDELCIISEEESDSEDGISLDGEMEELERITFDQYHVALDDELMEEMKKFKTKKLQDAFDDKDEGSKLIN